MSPSSGEIFRTAVATGETTVLDCGNPPPITNPSGIKFSRSIGTLFVTDIDPTEPGLFEVTLDPCTPTPLAVGVDFQSPVSIASECDNEVLIADPETGTITRVRNRNGRTLFGVFGLANSIVRVCVPTVVPEPTGALLPGSLPTRAGSPLAGRVSHPLEWAGNSPGLPGEGPRKRRTYKPVSDSMVSVTVPK